MKVLFVENFKIYICSIHILAMSLAAKVSKEYHERLSLPGFVQELKFPRTFSYLIVQCRSSWTSIFRLSFALQHFGEGMQMMVQL